MCVGLLPQRTIVHSTHPPLWQHLLALLAHEIREVPRPAAGAEVPHPEAVPHAPDRERALADADHEVPLIHHQGPTLSRAEDDVKQKNKATFKNQSGQFGSAWVPIRGKLA